MTALKRNQGAETKVIRTKINPTLHRAGPWVVRADPGSAQPTTAEQPPISDLGATWVNSTTVFLEWTAPSDAARYHVIYSDKPIVEPNSLDPNVTNRWAAYAIGPSLTRPPGQRRHSPSRRRWLALATWPSLPLTRWTT